MRRIRTKKTVRLGMMAVAVLAAAGLLSLVDTQPAWAAFPGLNGRIAFDTAHQSVDHDTDIYTVDSGGEGRRSTLITSPADELDASFSADGQKVAYASSRGGGWHIFVIDANTPLDWPSNTDSAVRVTSGTEYDRHPTFSPDGTKIAFARIRADQSESDIYVKNSDGSGQATLLADAAAWDTTPEWSPDGGKVAFVSAADGSLAHSAIYTTDALGGGTYLRVTGSGEAAQQPSWSPDGRQIAYTRGAGTKPGSTGFAESGVYRTSSDGTGVPVPVVNWFVDSYQNDVYSDTPAWSPDGRQIAFVMTRIFPPLSVARTDIFRINSDGSGTPAFVTAVWDYGIDDPSLDWQPLVPQVLILDPNALTIDWRDVLTIPGRLFLGPGNPMPGQRVYLEERPSGSKGFAPVPGAEATTAEDGSFRFEKVQPLKNTEYRVRFDGEEAKEIQPAMSPIKAVDVRVLLSLGLSTNKLMVGKSLTVSGGVQPSHGGEVTLTIKRDGEKVATKRAGIDEASRYSLGYEPPRTGNYTVVARFPADEDHAGDTSRRGSFSVVR